MKKIFLDTNIILDMLDSDRTAHVWAVKTIEKCISNNFSIVISEDMLSTVFYIIKNKSAVLGFFESILNEWEIVPFGAELMAEAIGICKENPEIDFEDLLQCLCAKKHNCVHLITNDKKFYNCGVQVVSSLEFASIDE